ncbi:MAG: hypothetical protein HUJ75_00045, partial [Parasporobacterium sp.]|nr:hypothetical protein [Parasporobacterium sp.]
MNLIVEEISGYYREYNEGISELLEGPASSFGEPVKKALGLGTVKSSALHGQLFEKVKAAVE